MINKKLSLVIVFLLGVIFAGCADSSLNGTWITNIEDVDVIWKFDNGKFEQALILEGQTIPVVKGTYKTKDNVFIGSGTHIHTSFFSLVLPGFDIKEEWIEVSKMDSFLRPIFREAGAEYMVDEVIKELNSEMTDVSSGYSINGNELTISYQGYNTVFIRQ